MAFLLLFVFSPAFAQEDLDETFDLPDLNEEGGLNDGGQDPGVVDDYGYFEAEQTDEEYAPSLENPPVDQYSVVEGDTLWDICNRILGTPWYWQKVWALNPHIANPHWIYPGNVINFKAGGQMGTLVGMEGQVTAEDLDDIPEIMDEDAWGVVSEGGRYQLDQYMTALSSNAYNFYNFRRDGFIAKKDLKYSGTITNSKEDLIFLSEGNSVYIKPTDINKFSIGQHYQIFKQSGEVEHPKTGDDIGYKILILGKCVVKRISKKVVVAEITNSFDLIQRGARVRPWKNPVKDIRPRRNKVTLQGYIVETLIDNLILGEHQVVFLDKGIKQGIEEGNRLFVIRQLEPTGYDDGYDIEELPFEKIGELIVLSAGSETSVALVSRSLTELGKGDRVSMEKNY